MAYEAVVGIKVILVAADELNAYDAEPRREPVIFPEKFDAVIE